MIIESVKNEISLLEQIIEHPVTSVSMHRPSQNTLDANINIPNVINSYSHIFFKDFKYISDSRHNWRENAEEVVSSKQYQKLHILTHPFWYSEHIESCRSKLFAFIIAGNEKRYEEMNNNFKNLNEFILKEEIV